METLKYKYALIGMILVFMTSQSQVQILKERFKGSYKAANTADYIPAGISYAPGYTYSALQATDASTGKRSLIIQKISNTDGASPWTKTNVNTNSIDPTHIVNDASSNVYVLGNIVNSSGRSDMYLTKYNTYGTRIFELTYTSSTYSYELAQKVQVDNSGNIYVLGYGYNPSTKKTNMIFLKYNSTGVLQFTKNYSSTVLNTFDQLKIDATNNSIYLGGTAGNIQSKMVTIAITLQVLNSGRPVMRALVISIPQPMPSLPMPTVRCL